LNQNFLILTYNVGNGRADPEKLVSVVRKNGVDIIGLQELDQSQSDGIERRFEQDYPYLALFQGGICGKGDI